MKLGYCLADHGDLDGAERHLSWCLERKPNHPALKAKLREIARRRLEAGTPTAATGGTDGPVR
jgi:Tfp pilus assembly protein PilF